MKRTRSCSSKLILGHQPSTHRLGEVSLLQLTWRRRQGEVSLFLAAVVGQRWSPLLGATNTPTSRDWEGELGEGSQFRVGVLLAGQFNHLPGVTRQRGHSPTDTLVLALPQPNIQTTAEDSPPFLLFLPPELGGGSTWAGSTIPPSAKPTGGQRDNSRFLPSPSLPRVVTGRGLSIAEWQSAAGQEGTEASSLRLLRTRKEGGDHFGQEQPTILVHQSLTKGGGEAKSSSWGFCFWCHGRGPAAGVGRSPELQRRAVGSVREVPSAAGCRIKETLLLCGSALKKQVNAEGHLGEAGAVAWSPSGRVGRVCPSVGRRKGSLGQVFHWQLLLQIPVVGDRHILVGGGHQ